MSPALNPLRVLVSLVAWTLAAPAVASPVSRFDGTLRGGLAATGNTLGLSGTSGGPSTNDGIGAFIDATNTLQAPGWPLGTTLDWALASSGAVLDLPANSAVLHAELVWSGTVSAGVLGSLDAPVILRTPSGLSHEVAPRADTASPGNGTMNGAGYYGRSADVTALVEGTGTYRVGRVPSSLSGGDAAAGWALFVVYQAPGQGPSRVTLMTLMEDVGTASSGAVTAEIGGLCIPSSAGQRSGRLVLAALEGDANITGETLRWARQTNQLGDNGSRIAPPGLTLTNPLVGRLGGPDGLLDTRGTFGASNHTSSNNVSGARQGFDLAQIDTTVTLATNWSSGFFRPIAGDDLHSALAVGMAIRHRTPILSEANAIAVSPLAATLGTVLTVTVTLQNGGDAGASGGVFTMAVPAGLSYVANSFLVNGAFPPGGQVANGASLASGIGLPNIGEGATATVRLQLRVDTIPAGTVSFAPRVVYQNQACAGAPVLDVFDPTSTPPIVFAQCGNGRLEAGEVCDDGNAAERDGCGPTCTVEAGWTCGPNPSAAGTPAAPDSRCSATCGDGRLALGFERCDDGNRVAQDGCNPSCLPEYGWLCTGGPGEQTSCVSFCGDGQLARGAEECDDGGQVAGDGCGPSCRVEPGFTCEVRPGGTPANPDSVCGAVCGDGALAPPLEACDDGGIVGGDGCSAECGVERGWTCGAGAGERSVCAVVACGDGVRALPAEACDDGNQASGDGCDASCVPEVGFTCVHTADDGDLEPDSRCAATCGDGVRASVEACDDGGEVAGDGCSETCGIEDGWTCVGAVGAVSVCAPRCGDGLIAGDEVCDDGNQGPGVGEDPDGCMADCRGVDFGWDCGGEPSVCVTTCGDGEIGLAVEVCDDGNAVSGDGCAGDCAEVERGWSCGDPPASPSVCEPLCGDGLVRGVEGCDDGNNDDGDGCSADCRVEERWACDELGPDAPSVCFEDSDGDGIFDDGDRSGVVGDNPCEEGEVTGCDDNCPAFGNPEQTFPSFPTPLCPPYDGPRTQGGGGGCGGGGISLGVLLIVGWVFFLSRQRLARARGVLLGLGLALVWVATPEVRAQEVDPRAFEPSLSPHGVLSVETTATNTHLAPFVTLAATLANDEVITRVSADRTTRGPLRERLVMTLAGGLALWSRLEVALGLPLIVTTTSSGGLAVGGGNDETGTGLGDLRVAARVRLLGPEVAQAGFGLGLSAELTLPTGDGNFRTDGGVAGRVALVADHRDGHGRVLAVNAGYRARRATAVDDLEIDDEARFGFGCEMPLATLPLALVGELNLGLGLGESAWDEGAIASREVALEALGGLKWRAPSGWVIHGAAGAGLTQGYGASDFRAVIGVGWNAASARPAEEPLVPAEKNERRDAWREEAVAVAPEVERGAPVPKEVFDAIVLADPDTDSDGVLIPADRCPDEPEDLDGFEDDDGCPELDNDKDGIPDVADKCPGEAEVFNGIDDDDGCPDEGEAVLKKDGDVLKIAEKIRFKSGSAELLPSDKAILDPVAVAIQAMGAHLRLRIEGHTDNLGDREFNVDLAERRAWSVRAYLIEKGCDGDRLFPKGFGPTRPVASNASEPGRALNRRVEFHVIRPGERLEGDVR